MHQSARILEVSDDDTRVEQIHGAARSLVSSMEASRQIPTATSVRTVPAKLLVDNRLEINEHRVRGDMLGSAIGPAVLDGRRDAGIDGRINDNRRSGRTCRNANKRLH